MTRLIWDDVADRHYESGVDQGVFYPNNGPGEAWNGLVSVEESPSDSDSEGRYIDGVKVHGRQKIGSYEATLSAFTYPAAFNEYVGLYNGFISRQRPRRFNFSYRITTDTGHKIHIVYNAEASPTSNSYSFDDTTPFSWEISTKPTPIEGAKNSAHIIIDTSIAYPETIQELEDVIYGSDAAPPTLPSPNEILAIFEENSILRVVDNGDGTFTVTGPDTAIKMLDPITFEIAWPSAVMIDETRYKLSSL